MTSLPNTIEMPQTYYGTRGPEAIEIADHDLDIEIGRALAYFEDIHPRHVSEALHAYAEDYLEERARWDRWAPAEFEDLAEGLETVSRAAEQAHAITLHDALEAALPATQESFVNLCNEDLIDGQDLTLGRRIDLALRALALELEAKQ